MDISYYKEKYEPINGKWYIKELLGEGSYGKVFRIEYKDVLGKTTEAALKVITIPQSEKEIDSVREALQDDNSVNQYFTNMASKIADEFDVMAQLKGNTNIVSYEEHDIFPHDNGIGYDILIRMELLKPLNKLTDNVSEQEVIKLGIDICKALEVCQKHNIVHRDIKPENIFMSPMGDYKLGDFGVAKTMKHDMTVMTVTGTYVYMAPELKKGEECGTNVDIYSLGMVMYKLLNFNREPFLPLPPEMFTFEQREQALIDRMKGMPLPKPANASERLSEIILKACEYNPKTRYESPVQMRMELESLSLKKVINTKIEDETVDENLLGKNNELEETVGLFSEKIVVASEEDGSLDETISLFDGKHTTTKDDEVLSDSKENDYKNPGEANFDKLFDDAKNIFGDVFGDIFENEYIVYFSRESTLPLAVDIYVDGSCKITRMREKTWGMKLSFGKHKITISVSGIKEKALIDVFSKNAAKKRKENNITEIMVESSTRIKFSQQSAWDKLETSTERIISTTKNDIHSFYSVKFSNKNPLQIQIDGKETKVISTVVYIDGIRENKAFTGDFVLQLSDGRHEIQLEPLIDIEFESTKLLVEQNNNFDYGFYMKKGKLQVKLL